MKTTQTYSFTFPLNNTNKLVLKLEEPLETIVSKWDNFATLTLFQDNNSYILEHQLVWEIIADFFAHPGEPPKLLYEHHKTGLMTWISADNNKTIILNFRLCSSIPNNPDCMVSRHKNPWINEKIPKPLIISTEIMKEWEKTFSFIVHAIHNNQHANRENTNEQ